MNLRLHKSLTYAKGLTYISLVYDANVSLRIRCRNLRLWRIFRILANTLPPPCESIAICVVDKWAFSFYGKRSQNELSSRWFIEKFIRLDHCNRHCPSLRPGGGEPISTRRAKPNVCSNENIGYMRNVERGERRLFVEEDYILAKSILRNSGKLVSQ